MTFIKFSCIAWYVGVLYNYLFQKLYCSKWCGMKILDKVCTDLNLQTIWRLRHDEVVFAGIFIWHDIGGFAGTAHLFKIFVFSFSEVVRSSFASKGFKLGNVVIPLVYFLVIVFALVASGFPVFLQKYWTLFIMSLIGFCDETF